MQGSDNMDEVFESEYYSNPEFCNPEDVVITGTSQYIQPIEGNKPSNVEKIKAYYLNKATCLKPEDALAIFTELKEVWPNIDFETINGWYRIRLYNNTTPDVEKSVRYIFHIPQWMNKTEALHFAVKNLLNGDLSDKIISYVSIPTPPMFTKFE